MYKHFPPQKMYSQTSSFLDSLRGVHLQYFKNFFSVHVMKAIAGHGVVNQLLLNVGSLGITLLLLLLLLGFMLEVSVFVR